MMHCFMCILTLGLALPKVLSAPSTAPYPPQPPGGGAGKRGLIYNSYAKAEWSGFFVGSPYVTYGSNGEVVRGDELVYPFSYVPTISVDANLENAEWDKLVPVLIEGGTKALFASNEPDNLYQANLTPVQAATVYRNFLQPYFGTVQLGTPAITGSSSGLAYLDEFIPVCTACTFNFVNVHFNIDRSKMDVPEYVSALKDFVTKDVPAIQAKHKSIAELPIAIGEFWLMGASEDEAAELMDQLLPWLDNNAKILFYQAGGLFEGYFVNAAGSGLTAAGTAYAKLAP